jgi:hypothetical protein
MVTINGNRYDIAKVPATIGLRAAMRLARVAAPLLKRGEATVSEAIAELLSNPELEDHVEYFCRTFAAYTQVTRDGRTATLSDCFDAHFAGDLGALTEWLVEAIQVNLSGFFAQLPALLAKVTSAGTAPASTSPSVAKKSG